MSLSIHHHPGSGPAPFTTLNTNLSGGSCLTHIDTERIDLGRSSLARFGGNRLPPRGEAPADWKIPVAPKNASGETCFPYRIR
jgi:hypothetical protein